MRRPTSDSQTTRRGRASSARHADCASEQHAGTPPVPYAYKQMLPATAWKIGLLTVFSEMSVIDGREEAMLRFLRMNPSPGGFPAASSSPQSRVPTAVSGADKMESRPFDGSSSSSEVTKLSCRAVSEELNASLASSIHLSRNEFLVEAVHDAARNLWMEEKKAMERSMSELIESEAESLRECETLRVRIETVFDEMNSYAQESESLS
jgi:hypothetical protein